MGRRGRRLLACECVSAFARIEHAHHRHLTLLAAIGTVLAVALALTVTVLILAIADVFHIAVTVVGAARAVAVAAVVVAVTTVILAGRVVTTAAAGRADATTTAGGGVAPTGAVTARVEAPRSGRRGTGPLQLGQLCAAWAATVDIPRFSEGHRDRCVCCASRDRHHQHHGETHTQRTRSYDVVSFKPKCIIPRSFLWGTYRRLEAERGAGMSQRTRRPYLRVDVRLAIHCRVAEERKAERGRWSDGAGDRARAIYRRARCRIVRSTRFGGAYGRKDAEAEEPVRSKGGRR